MLKRRNAVLAFLLVAVMLLGVGFAALSDTLTVTGTAAVKVSSGDGEEQTPAEKAFEEDIYFHTATVTDTPASAAEDAEAEASATGDTVTITINENVLNIKDDAVVVSATIKNDSAYDVKVTLNTDYTTADNNFMVTSAWAAQGNGVIDAGSSANVNITVTLLNALTADVDEEFEVSYSVAPVA